jgi:hypothetical protein
MYMTMIIPCRVKRKTGGSARQKYWKIIAENLKKAGWSWDCSATVDYEGQTIWTVDAHRNNGARHIVRAYELFTAFRELERAVHQT